MRIVTTQIQRRTTEDLFFHYPVITVIYKIIQLLND